MNLSIPFFSGRRAAAEMVLGDDRELLVGQMHAKHFAAAKAGRVFSQTTTPLGLAIPIYTATALGGGALPLWNPPNSGVMVVLQKVNIARASGTADFATIGLMARALDAIATGQVMTALAEVAPINGSLLVGGNKAKTRSSNAGTNTVTAGAAGDYVRNLFCINLEADTGTAHASTVAEVDFDGTVLVPPGVLVYLAATKASVAIYTSTLVWEEIPVPV